MMAETTDTTWTYDLIETSEDRSKGRLGVVRPFSHQLVGVDGNNPGGLSVFPGFLLADETTVSSPNHDGTSRLLDAFPFNINVGSDGYAYGYVFRMRRSQTAGATISDVFVSYWNSRTASWTRGTLVLAGASASEKMGGTQWGRFLTIGVRGTAPITVYINQSNTLVAQTAGPGSRPTLIPYDRSYLLLAADGRDGKPAWAQILLKSEYPSQLYVWPPSGTGSGTGTGSGDPVSCSLSAPQESSEVNMLEPGNYTFAYVLRDSRTGRRSALSTIVRVRTEDFLVSATQHSNLMALIEILYDGSKWDQAMIYRSVRTQVAGGTYVAADLRLEAVIDLEDYRACHSPAADGSLRSVYFYTLTDEQLVFKPAWLDQEVFDETVPAGSEFMTFGGTQFVTRISPASNSTTDEVRREDIVKGLGEVRWSMTTELGSTELFPPFNRFVPDEGGNEMLALRKVGENAIGWAADRMYLIRKETIYPRFHEMHVGFGLIGRLAVDVKGPLAYFVTPFGLKAVDENGALDDVRAFNEVIQNEWDAADLEEVSVAHDGNMNALFVLNPEERHVLSLWFNTAVASEIHDASFVSVRSGKWPLQPLVSSASLVARALWFQGAPADDDADTVDGYPSVRVFVVDQQKEKLVTGASPYMGYRQVRTMDVPGDARFNTLSDFESGSELQIDLEGDTYFLSDDIYGAVLYVVDSDNPDYVGRKALVRSQGSTTDRIRLNRDEAPNLWGLPKESKVALSPVYFKWVGSIPGIQAEDEQGNQQFAANSRIRVKHLDAVGCSFSSVSGAPTEDNLRTDHRFRALAYEGEDSDPKVWAYPRDAASGAAVASVVDEESINWAGLGDPSETDKKGVKSSTIVPGVEIACPDLVFSLNEVMVKGKIMGTVRTRRPDA